MSYWSLIAAVLITTVVCILAQNFVTPEKRLERRIRHRATVREDQFLREMSLLLGPPLTYGNRIKALQNGSEIFPAMFHNKMIVVDEFMVSVGSTNFDERSFRLNDEASLNVYDEDFGAAMTRVFEQDLAHCVPYTLQRWHQRKWWKRCAEQLALLLRTQL